jgi:hypothetical protein
MAESGPIEINTFSPVWTAGWQWPWVVVMALIVAGNFLFVSDQIYLGTGLLIGGLALTGLGVRAVVNGAADALADGTNKLCRAAAGIDSEADEASVYAVTAAKGSVLGLDVAKRYQATVLTVGEDAVTVYDDAMVNLFNTKWSLATDSEEILYEQIDGIAYADGSVQLHLTDGERSYPADERPADLIAAIDQRLPAGET